MNEPAGAETAGPALLPWSIPASDDKIGNRGVDGTDAGVGGMIDGNGAGAAAGTMDGGCDGSTALDRSVGSDW